MKKVAVVILNFKVKDEVLRCIESVRKSDYKDLSIIVIDNNSGDGLEEGLKPLRSSSVRGDDLEFIQTGDNLGYAGGNNIGIKRALERGFDYIFILNPDTVIKQNAITDLVDGAERLGAGIVGPKIYFSDQPDILWYAGGKLDLNNVLASHIGVDQKDTGLFDIATETDFVTGAALMVRREAFENVGLFDEKYFMYLEDTDFCFRAKKAGLRVMFIPKAVIYHKNASSSGLGSPLQDYFITRNRLYFAFKFLPIRTKFAIVREAIRNINNPIRRMAFFDFIKGKLGEGSYIK